MGQDSGYPPVNFDYNFEGTFSSNGLLVNQHVKFVLSLVLVVFIANLGLFLLLFTQRAR